MPEEGMLLWRSPDGAIGLCILTNLRDQDCIVKLSYQEKHCGP
jgi:hypothetical protein